MIKKIFRLPLLILCVYLPITAQASNASDLVDEYLKYGEEIVSFVNSNDIDVNKVQALVEKQTVISVQLLDMYSEKFPEGKKMLDEIKNNVAVLEGNSVKGIGKMKDESLENIESNWHDMGFMAEANYGVDMEDEDNEHFSDPAHVAIHPIMTLRASMDFKTTGDEKYKEAMKAETTEGMEQAKLLIEALEN